MLQRLKERKLVQWGLAYLAGAWVMLEVLSQIGDPIREDRRFQALLRHPVTPSASASGSG